MENGNAATHGGGDIVTFNRMTNPILMHHDTCTNHQANEALASESWLPATNHHLLANETSSNSLPLVQPLPLSTLHLAGYQLNCHTIASLLRKWLNSEVLCLNLSNNQVGEAGMKELARALKDPCFAQLRRLDVRHNRHDGIKPLTSALLAMKYQCSDGNSYKPRFFWFSLVCKRCGIRKANHTTTRVLEHLEEFSFSVRNSAHQDITALGKAISQGALPSLERVNLDDDLDYVVRSLDLGGHKTLAIEFLMQTVAERNTARAPSARALPGGMVQHPTARSRDMPHTSCVHTNARIRPGTKRCAPEHEKISEPRFRHEPVRGCDPQARRRCQHGGAQRAPLVLFPGVQDPHPRHG